MGHRNDGTREEHGYKDFHRDFPILTTSQEFPIATSSVRKTLRQRVSPVKLQSQCPIRHEFPLLILPSRDHPSCSLSHAQAPVDVEYGPRDVSRLFARQEHDCGGHFRVGPHTPQRHSREQYVLYFLWQWIRHG